MPIVILGDEPAFQASVLQALERICGGTGFVVDETGRVEVVDGPSCAAFCRHPVGCGLVGTLLGGGDETTFVQRNEASSAYVPSTRTVGWKTDQNKLIGDWCGGSDVEPAIVLGHELVHAYYDRTGYPPGDPEHVAVRGENQIRRELSLPARVEYGCGGDVPGYAQGGIPPAAGGKLCDCGTPLDTWLRGVARDARILLRCVVVRLEDRLVDCRERKAFGRGVRHFGPLIGAGPPYPPLSRRFAIARATRAASPHSWAIDRIFAEVMDEGRSGVLLESIGLTGQYAAALAYGAPDGGLRLVTDFEFSEAEEGFVRGPASMIDRSFDDGAPFLERVESLEFPAGLGGDDLVFDGGVQLVTVVDHGLVRALGLFGLRYRAYDGTVARPAGRDDARRWAAGDDVLALLRDLALTPSRRARVLHPPA